MRFASPRRPFAAPRRAAALLAGLGLAALALAARPGRAAGPNGPLAFSDGGAGGRDLYTVAADGSGRRPLASVAAGREAQPSWAPHGGAVAFTTELPDGLWGIARVDAASGDIQLVTNGPGDLEPDWRRDGRLIAFSSFWPSVAQVERSTITVIAPDGSQRRPVVELVSASHVVSSPSWSPDGARIAFVLRSDSQGGELYLTQADGRGTSRLFPHGGWDDLDPAWSPDGRFVAFAAGRHQPGEEAEAVQHGIWMFDMVTGQLGSVFTDPALDLRRPSWSPDGAQLAMDGRAPGGRSYQLYTANATGGFLVGPITTGAEPAWGPASAPAATATPPAESPTPPPSPVFPSSTPPPLPTIPVDPTLPPFPTLPPPEPSATGPAPTFPWPTATPTASPTPSATDTATPSPSPTPSPTASPSPTPPRWPALYLPWLECPLPSGTAPLVRAGGRV